VVDVRSYSAVETLKDGSPVTIRAIRREDSGAILSAFDALDPESVYTRLFTYKKGLTDKDLKQITDVDFDRTVALVVTRQGKKGGELIGGGRYVCDAAHKGGELAFLTSDAYRGLGIASLILKHLVHIARTHGLLRLEADVLGQNRAMLEVFRRSGLPVKERTEGGVVHVVLGLERVVPPSL
jgi:GNAT superfamily N-acetyltransferase